MDWQALFLDPKGRINRQPFWIGFVILFVAGIVLGLIPLIGQIVGLLLLYPWTCLYSKRLHDMGKSGWLQLAMYGIFIVGVIVAIVLGGGGMIMAMAGGQNDPAAMAALTSGLGIASLAFLLACLLCLGFLIWVGVTPGEPGPNQYGPSPKGEGATLTPTI